MEIKNTFAFRHSAPMILWPVAGIALSFPFIYDLHFLFYFATSILTVIFVFTFPGYAPHYFDVVTPIFLIVWVALLLIPLFSFYKKKVRLYKLEFLAGLYSFINSALGVVMIFMLHSNNQYM